MAKEHASSPKTEKNPNFSMPFRIFSFRESTVCARWPKRQIYHQIRRIMLTTMGAKHPISREWAREEHTKRNRKRKDRIRSTCAYCYTRASHSHILPFCRTIRRHLPQQHVLRRRKRGRCECSYTEEKFSNFFSLLSPATAASVERERGKRAIDFTLSPHSRFPGCGRFNLDKKCGGKRRRKNKFMAASASPQKGRKRKGRRPLSAVFAL